jgi:hypothetical protein
VSAFSLSVTDSVLFVFIIPIGSLCFLRSFAILNNELSLMFTFSIFSCQILFLFSCIRVLISFAKFFACSLKIGSAVLCQLFRVAFFFLISCVISGVMY